MDGVQEQQAVSLADEFLHELVQELDHENIVGITLGGSYARGTATLYSDVDLACFWREGVKPPPKCFLYRQSKLISIKATAISHARRQRQTSALVGQRWLRGPNTLGDRGVSVGGSPGGGACACQLVDDAQG
jgi:predicted nucleotidyltransferase